MSKYQFSVTTWQEVVQTERVMGEGVVICAWKAGIEFKNIKTQKLVKIIEKVVFRLHPTFEKPTQEVTVPENGKYSIAEEGYGSFPITINIHFKRQPNEDSPTQRPVILNHELEINKPNAELQVNAVLINPSKLLVENMLRYSFDVKLKPEKKKKKKEKDLKQIDTKEGNEQLVKIVNTDKEERKKVKEERKRDKEDKKEAKKLKKSKREGEKSGDSLREEKNRDDKLKKPRKSDKRVSETKPGIEPLNKKTKIMDKAVEQTLPNHQPNQNSPIEPLQINHHPTSLNNQQSLPKPKKSIKQNSYWNQLDEPTKKHKIQEVIGKIKEAEEKQEDDKLAKILTILGMVDYELGVKYQAAAGNQLEDVSGSTLRGFNEPSEDAKAGFNLGMIRGETMYALCKTIGLRFDIHQSPFNMKIKT